MMMATAWPNLLDSAESVFRLVVDEAKEYAIFLLDRTRSDRELQPGGRVWAENAPGGGAAFTFTIPKA